MFVCGVMCRVLGRVVCVVFVVWCVLGVVRGSSKSRERDVVDPCKHPVGSYPNPIVREGEPARAREGERERSEREDLSLLLH